MSNQISSQDSSSKNPGSKNPGSRNSNPSQPKTLKAAYEHCQAIANSHYENFPVASFLLPKRIRSAVAVIYAFARKADDLADEIDLNLSPEQRIDQLTQLEEQLDQIELKQKASDPTQGHQDLLFVALEDVIQQHQLPIQLFKDLLSAFKQDVKTTRYESYEELCDYARRSANPVGRLMLHLMRKDSAENLKDSDAICSALQFINFYQDVEQDMVENDRLYIPLQELESYELGVEDIRMGNQGAAMQALMEFQYHRAQTLLKSGLGLGKRLRGRFGVEIRMICAGGLIICQKLMEQDDLFSRPRLTGFDKLRIFFYAILR